MRTKIFVSYSHADRAWLEQLRLHLAVLERLELVEIWSDTRIEIGAGWEEEIEAALSAARVALLIVSPEFLASDYIWKHEMPPILNHQKAGMRVWPLIARPCAWRLAEPLARLQARPQDGRALSMGTQPEIDRDFAAVTYELAQILGKVPEGVRASEQWTSFVPRTEAPLTTPPVGSVGDEGMQEVRSGARLDIATIWFEGEYAPTGRHMQVKLDQHGDGRVNGRIVYDFGEAETEFEGLIVTDAFPHNDGWQRLGIAAGREALTFRETRLVRRGPQQVDLNGEYRAVINGDNMECVWMQEGAVVGAFSLGRVVPS